MGNRQAYRKKPDRFVIAVQLNMEMDGFTYEKWGSTQHCQGGDWLVNNDGDTYTITADSFAATYKQLSPGLYFKDAVVWAEVASQADRIQTNEGETHYEAGDYIVYNNDDGTDGYAVSRDKFESMYERVE